jgi:hypothetical protein
MREIKEAPWRRVACPAFGGASDWAGYVAVALVATVLAFELRPHILCDDAAITFRFAARLAAGKGFTYNDHERVLGASNPLYALVLAALVVLGLDVEAAARGLAIVVFVGTTVLGCQIAARLSGRLGGLLTGLLLCCQGFFRYQVLSGMESGLAVLLGLLVIVAVLDDRPIAAGAFLGLAVWNKLDASMLALAVAAGSLIAQRRVLARIAVVSSLVVAPWLLFATCYFGSPLPQSLVAKLGNNTGLPPDHLWVARFVGSSLLPFTVLAVGLLAPRVWCSLRSSERVATLVGLGWFLLHALALSVFWLGDPYPWYLTVLCPPALILGCAGGSRLLSLSKGLGRGWRAATTAGVVSLLLTGSAAEFQKTAIDVSKGNPIMHWEAFDFDRRLAGLFLARYADPSEVVGSAFGWVAYGMPNPFNDHSGLCSRRMRSREAYFVKPGLSGKNWVEAPVGPKNYVPLATFNLANDMYPERAWFTVFGMPDSVVARSGRRFLQVRLFEISEKKPSSTEPGLREVRLVGNDVLAPVPSRATYDVDNGRQPVHVVFAPAIEPVAQNDARDGAVFRVLTADVVLYERHVRAEERADPVVLPLRGAEGRSRVEFSLVTEAAPRPAGGDFSTRWRNVKVVVGDACPTLPVAQNEELTREWSKRNPFSAICAQR